ncbi:uncharacterized protein LACBIDRAFT_298554 [Laccaria bicolor S238N-H82]|uniref:Predicted protein n=1 Tax=Laccaria bicolor (strain S238N-H82 / ATCC MYA-4686) TaxID=486041 RepID=B0DD35_LACBS|nr:uncharacterized protein LACBIDRAFT_298554 [Laccaria bicolor S238N-H82]EDR07402.1 predicted protein [Laccaria bicolor S238N-H82]|eukprot:XP_001881794.1 predicted protein [Laccaria bicolor S238N-H82]
MTFVGPAGLEPCGAHGVSPPVNIINTNHSSTTTSMYGTHTPYHSHSPPCPLNTPGT